ncbi:hypothetical protein [Streptomyces sp. SBT349]|uniref:hypothetical protein n=1 Tax=Streptomyces sp. SBT349 TaxID=1580539 RepID=UPI00066C2E4C|nr:hypothetical protein [Streptomyces sp. SBT349]
MTPPLPVEFLAAVAAGGEAGSGGMAQALGAARDMAPGRERDTVLRALLEGAFAGDASAPGWLPAAGASSGDAATVAAALAHPGCSAALRAETLRAAPEALLAALAERSATAAEWVVAELRHRTPEPPPPITPGLLREPTPAQLVLRASAALDDEVFDAVVRLLPGPPAQIRQGENIERWMREHQAAKTAWQAMWLEVLRRHPTRHERLLSLMAGSPADSEIRHHLLGTLPDAVEPRLLESVALADLEQFAGAVLTTRICREIAGGLSREEARERFADEVKALSEETRRLPDAYLGEMGLDVGRGTRAAVNWVARAAAERWRLLLSEPVPSGRGGEARAALARRFADTALEALALWEPDPERPVARAEQLRWIRDLLAHLPVVEPRVRERLRAVARDAERGLRRWGRTREPEPEFGELLAVLWRAVARVPAEPGEVSARELAHVPEDVLAAYLERHGGDDALVEKALLSFARGRRGDFAAVLARHSSPGEALPRLTRDLRRLLDEGPGAEAWTRAVVSVPACGPGTVRALPAWAALRAGGPVVNEAVRTALGDDEAAWTRLATGPVGPEGARAWLRLGEILDAARDGTAWPKPPPPPAG